MGVGIAVEQPSPISEEWTYITGYLVWADPILKIALVRRAIDD